MAARAIWKGVVTFKGVEVPVKLFSACSAQDIHFNLLHGKNLDRVTQKMINPNTGEAVASQECAGGWRSNPANS